MFTEVYLANYASLIRLAALLVDGVAACEDVVQEAYVRVAARRPKLADDAKALAYLRQTVVNLSRSSLRRTVTARKYAERPAAAAAGPDERALDRIEQAAVLQALRRLPRRQREVLALRYYAELSEAEVADALGLSSGSVKAYASRGLDRLAKEMAGLT
jgi:RNA polymerase sigma-70 factor (sigma-E family)